MKDEIKSALEAYKSNKNRNNLRILFSLFNQLTKENMQVSQCSTCIKKIISFLEKQINN